MALNFMLSTALAEIKRTDQLIDGMLAHFAAFPQSDEYSVRWLWNWRVQGCLEYGEDLDLAQAGE